MTIWLLPSAVELPYPIVQILIDNAKVDVKYFTVQNSANQEDAHTVLKITGLQVQTVFYLPIFFTLLKSVVQHIILHI